MNTLRPGKLAILILITFLSAGCFGVPGPQPGEGTAIGTATIDALAYTQSAATISAELTSNAPTIPAPQSAGTEAPLVATLSPTDEPLPSTSTPLPTNTPLPSDTPAPTSTPTLAVSPTATLPPEPVWELSFYDDFTTTHSWVEQSGGLFRLDYAAGGYRITNEVVSDIVFSTRTDPLSGVRVETNARHLSGPQDSYFGVICNFINGGNYYLLGVGADGWFGIVKKQIGQISFLAEGMDTTGSIRQSNQTGTIIRGDCFNGQLVLWVNGSRLLETKDSSFSGGSIGMGVGTRRTGGAEVHFDDFYLYTIGGLTTQSPTPTP